MRYETKLECNKIIRKRLTKDERFNVDMKFKAKSKNMGKIVPVGVKSKLNSFKIHIKNSILDKCSITCPCCPLVYIHKKPLCRKGAKQI